MPNDITDLPLKGRITSVRAVSVDEAGCTVEIIWTSGATVRRARFWDGRSARTGRWTDRPQGLST